MRLIDADALKRVLNKVVEYDDDARQEIDADFVFIAIDSTPTIDAAPVVQGRWESVCGCIVRCNSCGSEAARKSNFCPNCGAKMDGKEKVANNG